MDYNSEQKAVLNSKLGVNVAVSAGAGAGKSTILVEKLIGHILNDHLDPENILVVTFTNDAANSIRAKIKNKIRAIPSLEHLIPKVDAAHIETTDAFRLFLVKKYAKELNINRDISLVGDDIFRIEQYRYINTFFDHLIREPILNEFAVDYLRNSEVDLSDFIVALSTFVNLDNNISKEDFINEIYNKFCSNDYEKWLYNSYLDAAIDTYYIDEKYQEALEAYNDIVDDEKLQNVFETKFQYFDNAKTKEDYYKALLFLINDNSTNFKSGKNSEEKRIIKGVFDEFKNIKLVSFDEYQRVDFPNLKKYIKTFLSIAYDLAIHIFDFKKQHGAYSFKDIENMSNHLVTIPSVNQEIKNTFKIIMIDEYQDTSDVQNDFYDHISNNNLFLVGDIKQSIYGFRGANPENFSNKLKEIKNSGGELYHMNYNYRSRKEVIDLVNDIFLNFMDEKYGGVNYKNGEALKKMIPQPPIDKTKGIFILPKLTIEQVNDFIANFEMTSESKINDNIAEIYSIAFNILARIKDAKEKGEPLKYSSFAVLTRVATRFDLYRQIFSLLGIPVNILKEEDITETEMVKVTISFIKLINLLQKGITDTNLVNVKFYLTSVLRSYLFSYSDQDIYEYIVNDKYVDSEIYSEIYEFSQKHLNSSIYDIVIGLINEFHVIDRLPTIDNAINSITKLNFLLSKIKEMDEVGYLLDDLVYYLENMAKLKIKLEVNVGKETDNAVTIQTIHGSKGLEYDIVYVADEEHHFSSGANMVLSSSNTAPYYVNPKYGFAFPRTTAVDNERKSSIVTSIEEVLENENTISEELRLFYVALTRAKQVCILPFKYDEKYIEPKTKNRTKCYKDIVTLSNINIPIDEFGCPIAFKNDKQETNALLEEVFYYDNPNQYNEIEHKRASIEIDNSVSSYILRRGTHYHLLMQTIDFHNIDTSFIKNEKDRQNIDKVLKNPVFQDIKKASIYKEYHFYDKDTNIDGVIDLLLLYEDKAVIIDYKLKNIDDDKYKTQLEAYRQFVNKTFGLPVETHLIALLEGEH